MNYGLRSRFVSRKHFNNVITESGEISREDLNELGVKTW